MASHGSTECWDDFIPSSDWSAEVEMGALGRVCIRPIRPKDAGLYATFAHHITTDNRRRRFFGLGPELTPAVLARFTEIDRQKEMAFVAVYENVPLLLGVSRMICNPDGGDAEFAFW